MELREGKLIERTVNPEEREKYMDETRQMQTVDINSELLKEVENIAYGVLSPLEGFMCKNELESVLNSMRLESGAPWTIPIILPSNKDKEIRAGERVSLVFEGKPVAVMDVEEAYSYSSGEIASKTFGTSDSNHPGVKQVMEAGDYFLGGKITLIQSIPHEFESYAFSPLQTRELFKRKGWKKVVGFQTRNVPHLGHEYVQKAALTLVDGLFINPVIGKKKPGDFRDDVILESYDALLQNYYSQDRATMGILKTRMRYAGPKEAIFHALIRKNFGCTHFIVGRDHAGVGDYYGPFDAHKIFDEFPDLGITPLFFRSFFNCKKCGGVVNEKICPHTGDDINNFSGTALRAALNEGRNPQGMLRNEVFEIIQKYKQPFVE